MFFTNVDNNCFFFISASEHEHRVGEIAESLGFSHVSLSSDVMAMEKIVPRGFTGIYISHFFLAGSLCTYGYALLRLTI